MKLAYVKHEKALEMEKIRNKQKLEELKLKREMQLNKAKLNVCEKIELEEQSSLVQDLAHIPSESKGDQVRQYLQSLQVTTSTSVGKTAVHPQASQAPVLTTTSTPTSTTCVLRASAPSFPTGAVTQTVYAGHYLEHGLSYPIKENYLTLKLSLQQEMVPLLQGLSLVPHQSCQLSLHLYTSLFIPEAKGTPAVKVGKE